MKRRPRADSDTEEYESDHSVSDRASTRTKQKASTKKKVKRGDKDSAPTPKSTKKSKSFAETDNNEKDVRRSAEGEIYIVLGKKRRASVRDYRGKTLIDIREFYNDNGEERPGKKGISLTVEQWQALKAGVDQIDTLISELELDM